MARLVRRHFLPEIGDATLARIVSPLGADIAACVASATCPGVGVGEELSAVPELRLAGTPMLLVNPRQPVTTEIGRAHVRTPVTNANLVCRLLLEHTQLK